jgi:hypothetical protein
MTTPYIDTYGSLNPHLHTRPQPSPPNTPTYTITRNPPMIHPTIRTNLQRVFRFHDRLFDETHEVVYPYMKVVESSPTILRFGTTLDVNYQWGTEYYHFLTEVLPSVLFLSKRYPTARIHLKESTFTEPMFRWFGVSNPITPRLSPTSIQVQCPYVECGNPSPEKIDLLRSVIESKLTFTQTHGILIRRHKTRTIDNESEVFAQLQMRYPTLEWVVYDHLSPSETASLFSKAAIIAGPHGAGFTNMLFSAKGIQILEFMPISEPNICYWHLAELLGNRYTLIASPVTSNTLSMKCDLPNNE